MKEIESMRSSRIVSSRNLTIRQSANRASMIRQQRQNTSVSKKDSSKSSNGIHTVSQYESNHSINEECEDLEESKDQELDSLIPAIIEETNPSFFHEYSRN